MVLSLTDACLFAAFCGLFVHACFNRFEDDHFPSLKAVSLVIPLLPASLFYPHSRSVFLSVLAGYMICFVTLFSSIVLYRLSPFHPLAKYPGPALAKLSKLWGLYKTSTGKTHLLYLELHRQYGPIVRTGPNEMSICDIGVLEPALGNNGMPKGPMWKGRINAQTGSTSLVSERNMRVHLERRKPWNKGLSSSSVREYEPILRNRVLQLVESLQEKSAGNHFVDLVEWISMFSYDFMGDMAFGGLGFELMRDGDVNGLWGLMEHGIRIQAHTQHVPWATTFLHSITGMGAAAAKLRSFVHSAAQKRARRGRGPFGPDLSSWLLDEANPTPDPRQFKSYARESQLIIVAGSDTTAAVISSIFHHILGEQKYFERLRREVDSYFPLDGGEVPADNSTKLSDMPFLNAVINEAMRITPPVPIDLQRGPERGSGGKMIGSIFIPEGTGVNIPPYVFHRDPRYFSPHPDQFLPDRWLPDTTGLYHTLPEAYIPFSLGPMNCPGKGLALLELRMVVATLVQQLDMELQSGYDTTSWETKLDCYFVFTRGTIPVKVKLRVH
ncbi:hypothetical protein HYPSUDRAFT_44767 [Hypholoma sublateritium FD-334 SS-4]|uniref:Cytochrome P450 n=1 Tax=Hypholoma sublateritium (strain FD-334 SS-4) TaxID=945553 RepID=A0A0D2NJ50_HYPSF|nr:hypothetical protein HYPSUDRAFT_44767 [Hypholoma sublateritium FD-334 SS-4]